MPAEKKEFPKHDNEYYKRWMGMIQRCFHPTTRSDNERRKQGITVENVWLPENPNALSNYSKWLKEKLVKHPEITNNSYRVARIDLTKNYGPNNCKLTTHAYITRHRSTTVMNVETVVLMRRFKRANPLATLVEMEVMFGFSQVNISRSIRGITWANANEQEPPIPKHETTSKKSRTCAFSGKCRNQIKEHV
jgi:hypothetical protein